VPVPNEVPMLPCDGPIVAAVSATSKDAGANQDAFAILRDAAGQSIGLAIADGVGGRYGGAVASWTVVAAL
jgi:serine/threonine protein phosphatase PrpC